MLRRDDQLTFVSATLPALAAVLAATGVVTARLWLTPEAAKTGTLVLLALLVGVGKTTTA